MRAPARAAAPPDAPGHVDRPGIHAIIRTAMRNLFIFGLIALLAAGAGLLTGHLYRDARTPPETTGTLLDGPRPLPDFKLLDDSGAEFTRENLKGRWSFLFFGFTHCPDVCPMTLATLAQTAKLLSERSPNVVFLSVDPARDTPAVLAPYVDYFNPAFTGVTGSQAAIEGVTQALGIAYVYIPGETPDSYTVDHSAVILLINPQGDLVAVFTPPHNAEVLARDLQAIRAYYGGA